MPGNRCPIAFFQKYGQLRQYFDIEISNREFIFRQPVENTREPNSSVYLGTRKKKRQVERRITAQGSIKNEILYTSLPVNFKSQIKGTLTL